MLQLRADGLTFQAIADRLNTLGHLTQRACPWNKGQVKRILDRTGPVQPALGTGGLRISAQAIIRME
jgi:hypothetical protein